MHLIGGDGGGNPKEQYVELQSDSSELFNIEHFSPVLLQQAQAPDQDERGLPAYSFL